jgi:glutamate synthase (NADPH/NADH) small chain
VVFDRHPEIGGLLTFGIPAFKLEKQLMELRRKVFTEMGIEFRLQVEVGRDIAFADILANYDAVFIGIGTYTPIVADLINEDAKGVFHALEYLIANTYHLMGVTHKQYPYVNLAGQRVVVLGGGDTAMDCLRTAIRQGASDVACAYRRDRANMPGSAREVKNAEDERVRFFWNLQPQEIVVDKNGNVRGVKVITTRLGEPDARGRQHPNPVPGTETVLDADSVIMAFGFLPSPPDWLVENGIGLTDRQRIEAPAGSRYPFRTSHDKVFAGGDAVRGSDLVVTAIAEGRMAAESILEYLDV